MCASYFVKRGAKSFSANFHYLLNSDKSISHGVNIIFAQYSFGCKDNSSSSAFSMERKNTLERMSCRLYAIEFDAYQSIQDWTTVFEA